MTHDTRRPRNTAQIAPIRPLRGSGPGPGATTPGPRRNRTAPVTAPRTLLDGDTPTVLWPAAMALSTGFAARTWGNDATRLNFRITVPGGRAQVLDLRDELVTWLQRRGLDLGLTDDGTDVYMTWPAPRITPDIPPMSPGPVVFRPRTPGGPPVYAKPTITALGSGDHATDGGDVGIRFALTDNDDAGTLGIYDGTITQETLFTVLYDAGLITRREEGK